MGGEETASAQSSGAWSTQPWARPHPLLVWEARQPQPRADGPGVRAAQCLRETLRVTPWTPSPAKGSAHSQARG